MTNNNIYRSALIFLLLCSAAALLVAYSSQYLFDYQPCILCLYQRKPFWLVIIIALLFLFIPFLRRHQRWAVWLALIMVVVNIAIAGYHVGVERKVFTGPLNCSGSNIEVVDIKKLQEVLSKTKPVRCDSPALMILGTSMADWNLVYCFILLIATLVILRRK